MTFEKYPSTPSLKDVAKAVQRFHTNKTFAGLVDGEPTFNYEAAPIVNLTGTVKAHGTHGDVRLVDGELVVQSRNRIITPADDNQGFALFVYEHKEWFMSQLTAMYILGQEPMISGEWCGGNIQSGVGITGMEKAFLLFNPGIRPLPEARIFNVYDYGVYHVETNFSDVDALRKELDVLTLQVEENCPIAAVLNPDLGNTIGEGIVWTFTMPDRNGVARDYMFKMKGEKHQRGGKIPKVKLEIPAEQRALVEAFVAKVVTADRLAQGVEYLEEMNIEGKQGIGHFIKWVSQDVLKEHTIDLEEMLYTHGIPWKGMVQGSIAQLAKAYIMEIV